MSDDTSSPARGPQIRVKLLGGLVALVAAFLLAALLTLVQQANQQRDAAQARKQHSYDVAVLTGQIEGAFGQAESALGRYVINGDRETGTLYYDEWRHVGYLLDDLEAAVRDDPRQLVRARRLRTLYGVRGTELGPPAQLASLKKGWSAISLFAIAGKSDTLKDIAGTLRDMAAAENILLGKRSNFAAGRAVRANDYARLLSVVGALLALSVAALGWLVMLALSERRTAREIADMETDRADALEQAVAERTAELRDANLRLVAEGQNRAEAESKLRQLQKMEAVGQLTGGIAHDFNNMLAVVLGGLEMAKRRVEEQAGEASRHIDSALEGANRAAALTRRLLSFARAEPLLPTAVAPDQMLRDMSNLLGRTIGERIEVRILANADIWPIWVDSFQLENAILNLAVNARDAMDGAGMLTMKADNVQLEKGEVGLLAAGDYVELSVTDDGAGMTPATIERAFEPFFTTKPVGQGTGLGLSQISGFARQSGGDVAIRSTLGEGTTVSIFLPRHRGEIRAADTTADIERTNARPQAGTILVVEDDPRVRAATGSALTELGYTAILCGSGEEAIEQLDGRDDIALVITDVVMPGITGPELARAIRTHRPGMGLLFVTGYVGEAGEAESFGGSQVLRKPFTLRALADALDATTAAVRAAERAAQTV
ncbi:MAG TPA: ATP-binding protein [Sphingomonas sp.]|nr:ATP-binding protein [Sphingomonas sp.]